MTAPTVATYTVNGMTCQHCVAAVTEEIGHLAGVQSVTIDLHAGDDSPVTVTSAAPLDEAAVAAAVDEAGYRLVSTGS